MSDETYHQYLSKKPSDVTLVIDDTKLPAHRSILSKRSEYFRAMFSNNFIEAKFDNITLKDTNLKTFKIVLNYIYSGNFVFNNSRFTLDEYFQILTCAQYYVVDELVEKIINYFKCRDHFLILDKALKYQVDQLISSCTDWIKRQRCFETLFKNFNDLSPMTVEYLLKLKLRLNIAEALIFKTLVGWMRANPVHSSLFSDLLEYIELYLIEEEQITLLFEPTLLVDRNFCDTLLNQQREKANTPQKIVNQNVINNMKDLRIVEGRVKFDDNSDNVPCFNSDTFAKCAIVDLKEQFLLNCLKLNLWSTSSYTVSVSTDMRHWELVIDHLNYKCDGRQVLYFAERPVQFIRFQALSSFYFGIQVDIEALYSTEPFAIDPATTLIIPKHNIVPMEMLKWKTDDHGETTGKFIEGLIVDGCIRHKIDGGSIVFRWSQPYLIGSLKFLLKEESSYAVQVKATGDASTWKYVWSESNVNGLRVATSKMQPVMFVRIVGRRANSEYFDLYELECPASTGEHERGVL